MRIILKWVITEIGRDGWTESVWRSVEFMLVLQWQFGLHKMRWVSGLAQETVALKNVAPWGHFGWMLCTLVGGGGAVCYALCCCCCSDTDRKCAALQLQVCAVHEQFNKSRSLVPQTKLVGRRQSRCSVTLLSST